MVVGNRSAQGRHAAGNLMKILAPTYESILYAARALREGKLVGLPTETVYGIAADATNRSAILETFRLKRRPAENPLIVHVASLDAARSLVRSLPEAAEGLAESFWPGPLTLVLPKADCIPPEATGGLDTVAIRVPRSPEALSILREAAMAVTAPSANAFMSLSPTRAEHISLEILAGLECVIDGGPCEFGVESTVVDCCGPTPTILRPGGIPRSRIASVLGIEIAVVESAEHRSPGAYKRHYAPRTPVRLVEKLGPRDAGIGFGEPQNGSQIQLPSEPAGYARRLYAALYELDRLNLPAISIERPPDTEEWEAVRDRLTKAVHG